MIIAVSDSKSKYIHEKNTLIRFLTREEDGYAFAEAEDAKIIPSINAYITKEAAKNNKNVIQINLNPNKAILPQVKKEKEKQKGNALIINNLDDCIRQKGVDFIVELNFNREALYTLEVPLLFWVNKETFALISNQAADLFSQRRLMTVFFEKDDSLFLPDEHLNNQVLYRFNNPINYEELNLEINLLKKDIKEAEENNYPKDKIIESILELMDRYAKVGASQPVLDLFLKYNEDLFLHLDTNIYRLADILEKVNFYELSIRFLIIIVKNYALTIGNYPEIAAIYTKISDLYLKSGANEKAERYIEKAFKYIKEAEEEEEKLDELYEAANEVREKIFINKKEYKKATRVYQKSIQKLEKREENINSKILLAKNYFNLANTYKEKFSFLKEKELKNNFIEYYYSLKIFFTVKNLIKDLLKSKKIFHELLREEIIDKNDLYYHLILINYDLGDFYSIKGKFKDATNAYEEAIIFVNQSYKNQPIQVKGFLGDLYSKLANSYLLNKNLEKASEYYKKEIPIRKELLTKAAPRSFAEKRNLAVSYKNLSNALKFSKEYGKAFWYINRSLEIYQNLSNDISPIFLGSLKECYFKIGELYAKKGSPQKVWNYFIKAITEKKKELIIFTKFTSFQSSVIIFAVIAPFVVILFESVLNYMLNFFKSRKLRK